MPGPGSYHKPPSMVRETGKCGSVSKLGFGAGFVSKTKRFSDRNDVNSSQAPGPGHYGHEKLQKNFSKLGTTGTFAQPKHYRDEVQKPHPNQITPGPGDYNPVTAEERHQAKAKHDKTACFRSESNRGFQPPKAGPAPGQYEVLHTVGNLLPGNRGGKAACLPHAAFRSSSEKVSKELFYPEKTKFGKLPGPGAYDSVEAARAARTDLVSAAQPSCVFSNNMQNRFGKPYVSKTVQESTPGPGWYGQEAEKPRSVASSSFFMSGVRRDGVQLSQKPPGPAYYKPDLVNRKSFMLNATRKWI